MSAAAETLSTFNPHITAPASPAMRTPESLLEPSPLELPEKHIVHWFRKGLRLHDNPALREGLTNASTFRCVFIIDPWFASSSNVGINKWRFLLQCLNDLDESLKKLKSRLFVVRGQPADALPKLFQEWGTTALTFEEDPEPYGRVRDHNIMSKCREVGITVSSSVSHTLYKLDNIIERNGGKAPLTYHQFQALIASMPAPPPAESAITQQMLNGATTPISEDHDERFGVPTLEELGFETEGLKAPMWVGGETEALTRLERHLERKAWVASFGRPKMTPQSLLASQTGLSPYLRFGCLSTRLFYYQLTDLYQRVKRVRPPLSLHGQILWREFFYCAATRNPNFDRMEGNPICVQIPWDRNKEALAKWANGQTGFPWIDAIMTQLREEGWIHHLARHAVACFLTRGDLWISWEEGMKVFDELLLDADWSVNAGMWMWLSCSSFFQQFFHCYCPVRFGRKTDPNGDYIRKYVPILENMPTRYIHEPWVAPDSVQQSARCIVGRDYPLPMVDHNKASLINIERIKQVYAQLAKYKPQGSVLNTLQRPIVSQSSPSPTSIITSMNQSNYLCNQTPDPAGLVKPQLKVTDIGEGQPSFENSHTSVNDVIDRSTQIKQLIILPQIQCARVAADNISGKYSPPIIYPTPPNDNLFISHQLDRSLDALYKLNALNSDKQGNYRYKNIIQNYIENYSNPHKLSSPKRENTRVVFSKEHPSYLNTYNDKPAFYIENVLCTESSQHDASTIAASPAQGHHLFAIENQKSVEDNKDEPSNEMNGNTPDEPSTFVINKDKDQDEDKNVKFD